LLTSGAERPSREPRLVAQVSRLLTGFTIGGLLIAAPGCGAFVNETHYFRSAHPDAENNRNYFRVEVKARSFGTKIRYLAGYFDDGAVNQYFAEFAQPDSLEGTLIPPAPAPESVQEDASSDTEIEPVDPKLVDRRLVLLLSNNVDEIAAQIGAIAKGKQTQSALASLLNRDELEAAAHAQSVAAADGRAAAAVARIARWTRGQLAIAETPAQAAEADLLMLANSLAHYLGAETSFSDLRVAKTWLDVNRDRMRRQEVQP
jgi:hypothetical protein